jgi:hypothetical protein
MAPNGDVPFESLIGEHELVSLEGEATLLQGESALQ